MPGQTFQDPSELLQFVRRDPEDKRFYCTICEKFSHKVITLARNHVESQHFPDTFTYSCEICGEVLKTKSNFMLHRSRKHLKLRKYLLILLGGGSQTSIKSDEYRGNTFSYLEYVSNQHTFQVDIFMLKVSFVCLNIQSIFYD